MEAKKRQDEESGIERRQGDGGRKQEAEEREKGAEESERGVQAPDGARSRGDRRSRLRRLQ